jgi:hypothetical protein
MWEGVFRVGRTAGTIGTGLRDLQPSSITAGRSMVET